jgi:hypothetical protein
MVWIRMGEDEVVNSTDLLLPQKGGDHILSDIETILAKTTSVDEHSFPLREFEEDGVPMPYIDEGDDEIFLEKTLQIPVGQIEDEDQAEARK